MEKDLLLVSVKFISNGVQASVELEKQTFACRTIINLNQK